MMEGEQFSLCWNNFHSNLSTGFHTLLKDEDLVDVTLAAEGRYLKAHKTVLSVCSPFFKELFRVNPCKHPIVVLQDVNYGALCCLLQFMYQGEVSVSQEEIPTFMRVAETLKVKGLTDNNSSSAPSQTNSNGYENRRFSAQEQMAMKKPRPIKKIIRPMQPIHMRQQERPKSILSSQLKKPHAEEPPTKKANMEEFLPPASTSSSLNQPSPSSNHPTPPPLVSLSGSPAPPTPPQLTQKPNEFINSLTMDQPLLKPKDEPIDEDDQPDIFEETLDMSQMLDTTISEPTPSQESKWKADFSKLQFQAGPQDTSSPGTLQCILGRRGNPRLIVDGHVFYKKSVYKGKAFWYCKNSRTPDKCQAVCWTLNGNIVKWPYMHTHPVIPDVFNPDEDTEVPIQSLQDVLWQTSFSPSEMQEMQGQNQN